MKEAYLQLMERVVEVYTPQRFDAYIEKTRRDGITEHGFPRLCANIGILMAHGKALHLRHRFEEMMVICCRDIPNCPAKGKRGNDFSVREVLSAILELEEAGLYPGETIAAWKAAIAKVDPYTCYRNVAPEPPEAVDNWAAFNAAGEQLRCAAGLANTRQYVENQIASQLLCFDDSGMYRDPNDPMVYDLVGRNMLCACLHHGYNGKHRDALIGHFRNAAKLNLFMQSTTGELAYGGRSNQFIHNEAHLAVNMEFAATLEQSLGNTHLASRYKAAANYARQTIAHWLDIAPGQHVKNYYPNDSMLGCENYAYYDKYMVTVASFLYLGYLFCDESIPPSGCPATDDSVFTWVSSPAFRKLFCKAGSYFVEAELKSDHHYDAEGIGRIHRRGAPSAICLSVPASCKPNYTLPVANSMPLAICCGKLVNDSWVYGFDEGASFAVSRHNATENEAFAQLLCTLPGGDTITEYLTVSEDGITITASTNGNVAITLPAFHFDGKDETQIDFTPHKLRIHYKNWTCTYESGCLEDMRTLCSNRNGIYKLYRAVGDAQVQVHITITRS